MNEEGEGESASAGAGGEEETRGPHRGTKSMRAAVSSMRAGGTVGTDIQPMRGMWTATVMA